MVAGSSNDKGMTNSRFSRVKLMMQSSLHRRYQALDSSSFLLGDASQPDHRPGNHISSLLPL
jgi:hypothetical protein